MSIEEPLFPAKFTLNTGSQMPAIGLGTYRIRNADCIFKTLDSALEAGYRLFDTAAVYGNEIHIRNALRTLLPKYKLQREDIFITTKLAPSEHGDRENIYEALRKSLENLGTDYVDLYLIHFPGTSRMPANDPRNTGLREMTWTVLTELYDAGLANNIGVSNFTLKHLKELMTNCHGIIPCVNQVEWHPFYHDYELLRFCKENEILLQAYCSLGGSSHQNNELINNSVVTKIAKKHNATCAQVLLVWALQQDISIIPKSTNPERIKENISMNFKLSEEEVKALDALGEHKVKYAWDPSGVV